MLLTRTKCICELYLLSLKGFSTKFLLSYRKKNLRSRTVGFIEALRRTMGIHCVVLQSFEITEGVRKAL